MTTKLFDTVIYDDANTAIAAVPAQMIQVDLSVIAADVTVTLPATATAGQCVGIVVYADDGGVSTVSVAGAFTPFADPLRYTGDCALYTWDSFGEWVVCAQWRPTTPKPFLSTQYYSPPGIGATISPPPGELASIDLFGNGGSAIADLTTAAATAVDGQCVGVQLVNTDSGSVLTFAGVTWPPLTQPMDVAIFTWSASQVLWVPTAWDRQGEADAFTTYDASGNVTAGDTALVAGPIDAFGRPQIWDHRANAGNGAVFRNGSWTVDGDPANQTGEGYASYGPAGGTLDASNGMIGRVKYDRFQLRRIIGGVDIGSAFRVDPTSLYLTNDSAVKTAEIVRSTGNAYFGTVTVGGAAGSKWSSGTGTPEGAVVGAIGDLFSRTDGGAGTSLYVKESGAGNTGWVGK